MWKELPPLEKYNFRRRAKRLNDKIVKIEPDMKEEKDKGRKSLDRIYVNQILTNYLLNYNYYFISDDAVQVSSKGRVLAKSKKLANFCIFDDKAERLYRKSIVLVPFSDGSKKEAENSIENEEQDPISDSQTEKEGKKERSKSP